MLIREAEEIIAQMKSDRDKLVRRASSQNIDVGEYEFTTGGQVTGDKEPSKDVDCYELHTKIKQPDVAVFDWGKQVRILLW